MEQTYYAAQTQRLHDRLKLSNNAKLILRSYDDFKFGRLDQAGLGRMVRLSSNNRRTITDMIKGLAEIMATKPGEIKYCLDIIKSCTEILRIADEPLPMSSFPFTKFPAEIRRKVYDRLLAGTLQAGTAGIVAYPGRKSCTCLDYTPPAFELLRHVDMSLATLSSQIRDEFLVFLYRKYAVYFTCGCQLHTMLTQSTLLRHNLVSAKVHWSGEHSHEAFTLLAKCGELRELEVVISRPTTNNLNPREIEMRRFFTSHKQPRLCDALGADELFAIRGLDNVRVSHINLRQALRRTEDERTNLSTILNNKLLQPRAGSHDNDDED